MNCASNVYASPELKGEAVDTSFIRWIPGLGLTETTIFPHYQLLKNEYLDGLRVMEDITYVDSYTHEIWVSQTVMSCISWWKNGSGSGIIKKQV